MFFVILGIIFLLFACLGDGLSQAYTKLIAVGLDINDISILPHYRFLRDVDLSHNAIVDISPLGSPQLSRLTAVNLSFNNIQNPKIARHNSLQVLNLSHNHIQTIPDDSFPHPFLTRLDLSANEIEQLKGIDNPALPLRFLEARSNKLIDCTGLNPNIEELDLVFYLSLCQVYLLFS